MRETYDVVVVGGGPGGYPAAIRASQLGLRVALVESGRLGGECTNYGCIPTKSLLYPVELVWRSSRLPFVRGGLEIDYGGLMEWAGEVASRVSSGVELLLRGYGVDVYRGRASLAGPGEVEVEGSRLRAGSVIVATGTRPATLPGLEPDGVVVHDNRSILGLRSKPGRMLVVGGGYIGVEYSNLMAKLGVEVYLVEAMPRLLPGMDRDFSRVVGASLKRAGVRVYTNTRVESLERREAYAVARLSNGESVEADVVLVAVGRRPNTGGIGLERAGVELDERGFIRVDERLRTTARGVYASGDVTGGALLAHKAFMQGVVAAENAAGGDSAFDPRAVPAVVYTDPELASIGMTEDEARRAGFKARSLKYPLGGLARAVIEGGTTGFVKIVYDEDSKELLGVHVAAPHASEIAGEIALALEFGASVEDLALTIHPHPTISEAIREAAELVMERPIHYLLRRRPT